MHIPGGSRHYLAAAGRAPDPSRPAGGWRAVAATSWGISAQLCLPAPRLAVPVTSGRAPSSSRNAVTLSAAVVCAAALSGVPATVADHAGSPSLFDRGRQAGAPAGTTAATGPAAAAASSYELPVGVRGPGLATLTFAGDVGDFQVTVEGVTVPVPAFTGTTTVEQLVTLEDGSLTLTVDAAAALPELASFGVEPLAMHAAPGDPPAGAAPAEVAPQAAGPAAAQPTRPERSAPGPKAGPTRLPVPAPVLGGGMEPTWTRVYRHDFSDMRDVLAFQSPAEVNSALRPGDSENSPLQRPSVRSNVEVVTDGAAADGRALGVSTRISEYQTASGTARGWSNGRMMVTGQEHAPPVRVRARLRMTPSAFTKSAVMWWPAGGGWPWEVDFAETFGGTSTDDYWGGRQRIAQRWHADLNGDGKAKEELKRDIELDATQYHVYDLFITPDRMWIEIDGVLAMETSDRRYIPKGKGYFGVGKALTKRRDIAGRTDDAVLVDWVEIYRPS